MQAILTENDIPFESNSSKINFELGSTASALNMRYEIKLYANDFQRVNRLLEALYAQAISEVEPDYYLFSFTDPELLRLIEKPNDWNPFDVQLAKHILQQRNLLPDPEVLKAIQEKHTEQETHEKSVPVWKIVGAYLLCFLGILLMIPFGTFGMAFYLLIPLFGMDWYLRKHTLSDGSQRYVFTQQSRFHGRNILVISSICIAVEFLIYLFLPAFIRF